MVKVKGGAAQVDGRLAQGDHILSVNGEDLRAATQEQGAALLKVISFTLSRNLTPALQTVMGKVTLTVGRLKASKSGGSRRSSAAGGGKQKGRPSKSKSLSNFSCVLMYLWFLSRRRRYREIGTFESCFCVSTHCSIYCVIRTHAALHFLALRLLNCTLNGFSLLQSPLCVN